MATIMMIQAVLAVILVISVSGFPTGQRNPIDEPSPNPGNDDAVGAGDPGVMNAGLMSAQEEMMGGNPIPRTDVLSGDPSLHNAGLLGMLNGNNVNGGHGDPSQPGGPMPGGPMPGGPMPGGPMPGDPMLIFERPRLTSNTGEPAMDKYDLMMMMGYCPMVDCYYVDSLLPCDYTSRVPVYEYVNGIECRKCLKCKEMDNNLPDTGTGDKPQVNEEEKQQEEDDDDIGSSGDAMTIVAGDVIPVNSDVTDLNDDGDSAIIESDELSSATEVSETSSSEIDEEDQDSATMESDEVNSATEVIEMSSSDIDEEDQDSATMESDEVKSTTEVIEMSSSDINDDDKENSHHS